jgi:hypothetical protein
MKWGKVSAMGQKSIVASPKMFPVEKDIRIEVESIA